MAHPPSGTPAPVLPRGQGRRPIGSGHLATSLVARARPTSASRDQLLPLLPALAPLLPDGGLRRGSVVAVDTTTGPSGGPDAGEQVGAGGAGGGTSLAFALLAAASTASWCAAVGPADPGIVALAEVGVDLEHLVFVPRPGPLWAQVTAACLDGMDAVLVCPPGPVRPGMARRLAARARERRAVLVVLAPARGWSEGADVRLAVERGAWQGVGPGHGHLQGRQVEVVAAGRGAAARTVRVALWLPTATGRVAGGPVRGQREVKEQREVRGQREVGGEGGATARRLVSRHP